MDGQICTFIIIVMIQEVADYFNRFYNVLIRQHLQDPTLHSEWLYFLSMFKSEPLDPARIDLYLNILVSENKKKIDYKKKDSIASFGSQSNSNFTKDRPKNSCNRQSLTGINELKLQKKTSENIQIPYSHNFQFNVTSEPLQMRKISSADKDVSKMERHSLNSDSKKMRDKQRQQPFYGVALSQSPNINQYLSNLGLNHIASDIRQQKQQKSAKQLKAAERQRKLKDISARLVREFQANPKLRA